MHRYDEIAALLRDRIATGTLRVSERLPSIRQMSRISGFSPVTVLHAYQILEAEGLCEARARSGYFVKASPPPSLHPSPPQGSRPPRQDIGESLLLRPQTRKGAETFGATWIAEDLTPRAQVDRIMRQSLRTGIRRLDEGLEPEGDREMRREICRHIARRGTFAQPDEIIIAGSAAQACNLCLDALARPGDVVLVQSPGWFPLLATLKRRGLRVIALPADPDPVSFEAALAAHPVRLAILAVSCPFPTGISAAPEVMARLVAIAGQYGVTIIENDMFGDLTYRPGPRVTLKHFDRDDNVVQIGSFECTLPPEYGYAWLVGGRQRQRLLTAHYLNGHRLRDGFVQWGIARYLSGHSYERELRALNRKLARRMQEGRDLLLAAIGAGSGMQLSSPDGGFMCWLQTSRPADLAALSGLGRDVSFLPGGFCRVGPEPDTGSSLCLALNFSFRWTPETQAKLCRLLAALSH